MNIEIPAIITDQYKALCELVNNSDYGNLKPRDVANFLGKDYYWLLDATEAGAVPFAFGTRKGKGRGSFCFHVLPLFAFATQGALFNPVSDQAQLKEIIKK